MAACLMFLLLYLHLLLLEAHPENEAGENYQWPTFDYLGSGTDYQGNYGSGAGGGNNLGDFEYNLVKVQDCWGGGEVDLDADECVKLLLLSENSLDHIDPRLYNPVLEIIMYNATMTLHSVEEVCRTYRRMREEMTCRTMYENSCLPKQRASNAMRTTKLHDCNKKKEPNDTLLSCHKYWQMRDSPTTHPTCEQCPDESYSCAKIMYLNTADIHWGCFRNCQQGLHSATHKRITYADLKVALSEEISIYCCKSNYCNAGPPLGSGRGRFVTIIASFIGFFMATLANE